VLFGGLGRHTLIIIKLCESVMIFWMGERLFASPPVEGRRSLQPGSGISSLFSPLFRRPKNINSPGHSLFAPGSITKSTQNTNRTNETHGHR
jgi:hypothetical protein